MTDTTLKLHDLTKNFGDFTAVDRISLTVKPGEIYGFLGPNGAGKTTTIKMIAGLLQPSRGSITIGNEQLHKNPVTCKQLTGYIPDRPYLYEKLTGAEYLAFVGSLYQEKGGECLQEAQQYLELFDLIDWQNHLIEGYSHGMRQKLIMASIFMMNQPLIIVDEPMVGLDPKSARIVKELFKSKARDGVAIFLSTHSMEIAEELCDRIGIIVSGKLSCEGTMMQLRRQGASGNSSLEDIFLELTGAYGLQDIIQALREKSPQRNPAGEATGN
jgi:ABC-2 type transport system ATP-binding protein